jgi:hypothetical protein
VCLQVPAVRELLEAEIGLAVAALGTPEPDGGNLPIKYSKEFAVRSDRPHHIASHHMPCELSTYRALPLFHDAGIAPAACRLLGDSFRLLHDACGIVAQVPPSMRDVFPEDVGTIRVFGLQEVRAHAALCANQMSKARHMQQSHG